MVGGGRMARRTPEHDRESRRPRSTRQMRRVPLLRGELLLRMGSRQRDASADPAGVRHERPSARARPRRPAAPLFGDQARLQERKISHRDKFSAEQNRWLLGGSGLRMVCGSVEAAGPDATTPRTFFATNPKWLLHT